MDGILGCNSLLSAITSSWKFLKASYAFGIEERTGEDFTLTGDYVVILFTTMLIVGSNSACTTINIPIVLSSTGSFNEGVPLKSDSKIRITLSNKKLTLTGDNDTWFTYVSIFEFTK